MIAVTEWPLTVLAIGLAPVGIAMMIGLWYFPYACFAASYGDIIDRDWEHAALNAVFGWIFLVGIVAVEGMSAVALWKVLT